MLMKPVVEAEAEQHSSWPPSLSQQGPEAVFAEPLDELGLPKCGIPCSNSGIFSKLNVCRCPCAKPGIESSKKKYIYIIR